MNGTRVRECHFVLYMKYEKMCFSKAPYLLDNNNQEDKEVLILHLEDFLLGHHFCTRIPQHSLL